MYTTHVFVIDAAYAKRNGALYLCSTAAQTFADYDVYFNEDGPLAMMLPNRLPHIGSVEDIFGPQRNIYTLCAAYRIMGFVEVWFGQSLDENGEPNGLDMYERVRIPDMRPTPNWVWRRLSGQTEPTYWWRCESAELLGMTNW